MSTTKQTSLRRRPDTWGTLAALLVVGAAAACSSLLDVKNPNNVTGDALNDPASASAQANGTLSTLARAWAIALTPYAEVTDELTWIGSRDAWQDLDYGNVSGVTNEFVDAAFPFLAEARWMADQTIRNLSDFDSRGVLKVRDDLTRSYLYGAIAYTSIADLFENWPIDSDREQAAPPIGKTSMDSLYRVAINYATSGIGVAQATGNSSLELALTAARARARHAMAVWAKLNPPGSGVPNGGALVSDAAAVADANAALALAADPDWKFQFDYGSEFFSVFGVGFEVNERLESRIGPLYVYPDYDPSGNIVKTSVVDSIKLRDLIDNVPDPELSRVVTDFVAGVRYPSLTMLSARELHLIVAEAALAQNDSIAEAASINAIRTLDGLTAWNPLNAAHPRALAMLQHTRRVNTFLQGRRLQDHYRFRQIADLWQGSSDAVTQPGTVFPITITELLANPYCVANPTSC